VVACLRGAASGETCVPPAAYACVQDAIKGVAADQAALEDCLRFGRMCSSTTPEFLNSCADYFGALTPTGRQAVIDCMSPNQCSALQFFPEDIGSCIYDGHAA
jgi:hypothetical protein